MALSNPFQKLPAEITTIVFGLLESTDIQSLIHADPHMLRVFLQHELLVLRPLRRSLYRQFPGRNLTQAIIACRLRQIESTPLSQNRAKYQEVVQPILTQSPKALPVTKLNLGAISELYRLFRKAEVFTSAYSREAWEMTQDMAAESDLNPMAAFDRFPLSLPLSEREKEEMQKAYLLFDSCRHTLWFSTSFLQYYYCPDKTAKAYYIPWKSAYGNKLQLVRGFHAVLRFLLREYRRLLRQVGGLVVGDSGGITSQLQRREFSDRHDDFQFAVYLCSQGYDPLLNSEGANSPTECVTSLYRRYSQLKHSRRTCPLVVVADLKDSMNALFAGPETERDFWTSGAFTFDCARLAELDEIWCYRAVTYREDAGEYADESEYGNQSDYGSESD